MSSVKLLVLKPTALDDPAVHPLPCSLHPESHSPVKPEFFKICVYILRVLGCSVFADQIRARAGGYLLLPESVRDMHLVLSLSLSLSLSLCLSQEPAQVSGTKLVPLCRRLRSSLRCRTFSSKTWSIPPKEDDWSLSEPLERNGPRDRLQIENTSKGHGSFIKYESRHLRAGFLNISGKRIILTIFIYITCQFEGLI